MARLPPRFPWRPIGRQPPDPSVGRHPRAVDAGAFWVLFSQNMPVACLSPTAQTRPRWGPRTHMLPVAAARAPPAGFHQHPEVWVSILCLPAGWTWPSRFLGSSRGPSKSHRKNISLPPHPLLLPPARGKRHNCQNFVMCMWMGREGLLQAGDEAHWPASDVHARGHVCPALRPAGRGIGVGGPLPLHVMLGQNNGRRVDRITGRGRVGRTSAGGELRHGCEQWTQRQLPALHA